MPSSRAHWENAYAKPAEAVSWYQPDPHLSRDLIALVRPKPGARIVDVGGGASALVDFLLADGFDITVLDIADAGMAQARQRLGSKAQSVHWIVADVTSWRPDQVYDVWHDRAVLHFLTTAEEQTAYAATLRAALSVGGSAIIGGFAPGGRTKCSGLDIVQHDLDSLGRLLGHDFELQAERDETHLTPAGVEQAFRFHVFRRVG